MYSSAIFPRYILTTLPFFQHSRIGASQALKRKLALLEIILLVFLASSTILSQTILPAHASTSPVVCVADPALASCPLTPAILTPVTPTDTQLRVGVFLNTSASFLGFDIVLLTDHTILKPAGVDLTGTIVPGGAAATILVQCIGGVPAPNTACTSGVDGPNTLHFDVQGNSRTLTTTGLLFTAIYNITTVRTRNTPIGFQTGCAATSSTPICVTITTGTSTPDPETVQPGGFSDLAYYAIDSNQPNFLTVLGGSNSSQITLTSLNNFIGNVTLTATVSPSGPTISPLSPSFVYLTGTGSSGFSTVSVSVATSVATGNYNITVTAHTNSSFPDNSVLLHMLVPAPDFTLQPTPTIPPGTITINATTSGAAPVPLVSRYTFAGTVNLTSVPNPGVTASLSLSRIVLKSGATNSSAILTVSGQSGGKFNVTLTARGINSKGTLLIHQIIISVAVVDFGIQGGTGGTPVTSLSMGQNTGQPFAFTLSNSPAGCCFRGNVTLSNTVSPAQGLAVSCSPSFVLFNSPTAQTPDYSCEFTASSAGTFTVVVVGSGVGGRLVHAAVVTVSVVAPDFVMTTAPGFKTISAGGTASFTVSASRLGAFNGTLNLQKFVAPTGPTVGLSATSVTLSASSTSGGVTVTVSTLLGLQPGNYTVTIKAINGTGTSALQHTVAFIVNVAPPSTFHQVSIYSVTVDKSSPTIGDKVTFTVLVQDVGNYAENVTVDALVGDVTVDHKNSTLISGGNSTLTLTWDTSTWIAGTYVVGAKVLGVPGQKIASSNLLRNSTSLTLNGQAPGPLSSANLSQIALPLGLLAVAVAIIIAVVVLRGRKAAVSAT